MNANTLTLNKTIRIKRKKKGSEHNGIDKKTI